MDAYEVIYHLPDELLKKSEIVQTLFFLDITIFGIALKTSSGGYG